jgi:hypothetical protein
MQPPPELANAATLVYPYILAAAETARERDELRAAGGRVRRLEAEVARLRRALDLAQTRCISASLTSSPIEQLDYYQAAAHIIDAALERKPQ